MMHIVKLGYPENLQYRRWVEYWKRGGNFDVIMSNEIAAVEFEGVYLAGIMVHRFTGSTCCLFNGICRNPFADRAKSSEAVDFLIGHLSGLAKKLGYSQYVSLVGEESAKLRYRKKGIKEEPNALSLFHGET